MTLDTGGSVLVLVVRWRGGLAREHQIVEQILSDSNSRDL